jgi:hypothetical protein
LIGPRQSAWRGAANESEILRQSYESIAVF